MTAPGGGGGRRALGRRSLLGVLGAAVAGGYAMTATAGAREPEGSDVEAFSVAQGDRCHSVVPLVGDRPVEALYDYRLPGRFEGDGGGTDTDEGPYFQSNGTADHQRRDVTVSFLYRGPCGLSLVVVHDCAGSDDAGGAVSWTVEGVPADAEWAVGDDRYLDPDSGDPADSNYDRWDVDGSVHTVDWTWGTAGTDGGALRTADPAPALTIRPAFNERAALWGEHYAEDPIREWQFLSFPADRESPERTALALDEPVSLRAGACDAPDPGDGAEAPEDVVAVDLDLEIGSLLLDPRAAVPVELVPEEPLEPNDVVEESLRLGPPDVVDAGGGARPVGGGRGGDLVYDFPVGELGLGGGDTRLKLVGRTVDGRPIVGTAGFSLPDLGPFGSDSTGNDSDR